MLQSISNAGLAGFAGLIGLAIIAVIVAKRSSAPQAIQAAGGAIAQDIQAAVAPVNTAATNGNANLNAYSMPTPALQQEEGFGNVLNNYVP